MFALRRLRAGQVVGRCAGRRYAPDESQAGWNAQLAYLFGLSDGSVIDGAQGGNATRHINHACTPNVEAVERRGTNDELLVVIRAVPADNELLLDYALVIDGDGPDEHPCAYCTNACRGTMAGLAAMRTSSD